MNTTATIHANAIPVYADVDPDTFTIDPEDIRRKITPKTKAKLLNCFYVFTWRLFMSAEKSTFQAIYETDVSQFLKAIYTVSYYLYSNI